MERYEVLQYFCDLDHEIDVDDIIPLWKQMEVMKRIYYNVIANYSTDYCILEIYELLCSIIHHEYYGYLTQIDFRVEFENVLEIFNRSLNELNENVVKYILRNYCGGLTSKKEKMDTVISMIVNRFYEHVVDKNVIMILVHDVCREKLYKNECYDNFFIDFEELYMYHHNKQF